MIKCYALPFLAMLMGCQDKSSDQQAGQVGRYTIVHSPNEMVLLDTTTGKTWLKVTYETKDEPIGWEPVAREDNPEEYNAFLARNRSKSDEAK